VLHPREMTGNLEIIVGMYNDMQRMLLPVERPLVAQRLEAVDAILGKSITVRGHLRSHYSNDDPISGCRIGTECPIVHAK
jgi:dynein heavy chain, axonemal